MILQALCRYYDALVRKEKAPVEGFAQAKCAYAAELNDSGGVLAILPLGNGDRANVTLTVPRPVVRSAGVKSNFLCDNPAYTFGLDCNGNEERTRQCAEAYAALHHAVLDGCDSDAARAVLAFVDAPNRGAGEALTDNREGLLKGGSLVLSYRGAYVHDDPAVREAWSRYEAAQTPGRVMTCLVTGERLPVVSGHDKIKGVRNASTMGASLIAFNDYDAAESYGLSAYENSPVSERASFAFTTALNALLSDREHQCYLGDATVVYWAEDADEGAQDFFAMLMQAPADADKELREAMENLRAGRPVGDFALDTPFCVLALSPNAGRVSVRFFLQNTLDDFVRHLQAHYDRLQIAHAPYDPAYLKPWQLLRELANQNSRDKLPPPTVSGAFLRAMLTNSRYPEELLGAVILRIRAERAVPYGKAALIKAYLLQNTSLTKEEINVALNQASDNKPYLLGRLFSVLEQIQQSANPGINATIKDRFLASASATPGVVFPQLLRLQSAHMNKLNKGAQVYFGKQLGAILGKLDVENAPFPAQLSLPEQGLFFLGYYQQDQSRYEEKEDKSNG